MNRGDVSGEGERSDLDRQLETLLEEYGPWLRRTVLRTCPSSLNIQPDEIEQEVRLRLWRVLERESEVRHPASYLHRVVATATIDAIRRVKARREDPLVTKSEQPDHPGAIDPVTHEPSPETIVSGSQTGKMIQHCLGSLQDNRRDAVRLYLQGFTYQEVADLLDWTEAKARNLVSRGMQNLRDELRAAGVHHE